MVNLLFLCIFQIKTAHSVLDLISKHEQNDNTTNVDAVLSTIKILMLQMYQNCFHRILVLKYVTQNALKIL